MRKHLRMAKAREANQPVENDLRGLGDTSLFKDMDPEPILTVSRSTLSFMDLANKLDLAESGETTAAGHINIVCKKAGLSHKEKAIQLFAFALNLRVIANMDCILWEKPRLREALGAALESQRRLRKPADPVPCKVTLSAPIQLHLQQAGFAVQASEENQVLNDHQVRDYYSEMLGAKTAKSRSRKVG